MTFQTSSLRVAGQQLDVADLLYPSSKLSRKCFPESGLSSTSMYEDSESIKSWINTIYYKSVFQLVDSDAVNALILSHHPCRDCGTPSPRSDDFDSDSSASFCFDAPAWVPEDRVPIYYDSDESGSASTLSDDEAQYISIPSDSPWYRQPSPSPEPISTREFYTGTYPNSCSDDVRQVIAQQEHLLAIFHEELRRIIPHADGAEYNSDWLEDMDADVVLAPVETYQDLCWESVVSEKSPTRRLTRPLADVPIGFGDVHGAF
ncbi:hypothetical protein BU15DRAFT_62891 [Melanogaster broomeanus]|nr:hypothetical protein BU15DRAFT_62891 [Melanogaster broomeanus]